MPSEATADIRAPRRIAAGTGDLAGLVSTAGPSVATHRGLPFTGGAAIQVDDGPQIHHH